MSAPKRGTVQVGLIQMSCGLDREQNLAKAITRAREAAARGARIVCFQELFQSRYFPQVQDPVLLELAEPVDADAPTVTRLRELAAELEVVLIASLFERRAVGLHHNTAVVIDADGAYLGMYRKMHIPDDPHYLEKYYFAPGDLGYRVFRTRYADVGVLICWDQWYPEAARLTALAGAEIIFIPTAIGTMCPRVPRAGGEYHEAWISVQRGHAVANACYLAAVNRVGREEHPDGDSGIDFWGHSFLADPFGHLVHEASEDSEELVVAPVNLDFIAAVRGNHSFPFRDRRVDSYGGLTRLYAD